jgi:hypothetical protein
MHKKPTMHDPTGEPQSMPILQAKGNFDDKLLICCNVLMQKLSLQKCIAVGMSRDGESLFFD